MKTKTYKELNLEEHDNPIMHLLYKKGIISEAELKDLVKISPKLSIPKYMAKIDEILGGGE